MVKGCLITILCLFGAAVLLGVIGSSSNVNRSDPQQIKNTDYTAQSDISSLREFSALLKLNADGSRYSAEQFVKLSHELHALGISFADVDKILRQSIQSGLNQDRIKEFATAARAMSDLTKGTIPIADAFKTLTEDLAGGVEGVRKFNAQWNILKGDELRALRTQKDVPAAIQLITTRLIEAGKEVGRFR